MPKASLGPLNIQIPDVAIGYLSLMRRTRKLHTCAEPQQPRRPTFPLPESAALKAPHSPGGAFAFLSHGLVVIPPENSPLPRLIQVPNEPISGGIGQREYELHLVCMLDVLQKASCRFNLSPQHPLKGIGHRTL